MKTTMKNFILIVGIFLSFSTWGATPGNVEKYRKFVESMASKYQIPVNLILGVGICESGFGTSNHAKRLNNYFGIRGRYSKVWKTTYLHYDKPEDSIVAFCDLVARKRFYEKFSSIVPGVFYAFSMYDKNECNLFINWLVELDNL